MCIRDSLNPALRFLLAKNWIGQEEMATLHQGICCYDDDDNQTCLSKKHGILQVFRMAHHVRAAPECNAMIQP